MTNLSARLSPLLLCLAACPHPVAPPAVSGSGAQACGDAKAIPLQAEPALGFTKLFGTHYAELLFSCPSEQSCTLPADRQIELTIEPLDSAACEFATCKVPYLAGLPFTHDPKESCPSVLWTRAKLHLKSDAGTLDEQEAEVNVLATRHGEAFVRFMIESPAAFRGEAPLPVPRAVLLDVQLEQLLVGRTRGQVSALSAPLPSEPGGELRFSGLWTATWETPPEPPAPAP